MSLISRLTKAATDVATHPLDPLGDVGRVAGDLTTNDPTGQKAYTQAVAKKWGVSPETLWGVYGTESGFGHDLSTSSAGAQGYMQFLPSTARQYGVNPQDFKSSMNGAGHYLHDLGANTDPESPQTKLALNSYSGGGGSAYADSVASKGKQFHGGGPLGDIPVIGGALQSADNAITDTAGFIAKVTSPMGLGQLLASAFAVFFRFFFQALWKYALAPPWHRTQKAAVFYAEEAMDPKHMGTNGDRYIWCIPATLTFWAFGWAALFSRDSEGYSAASNARRTPLGKTLRKGQGLSARRKLIKAKNVKKKTPKKPKVHSSRAPISVVRYVSVHRPRAVTVNDRGTNGTTTPTPTNPSEGGTTETTANGQTSADNGTTRNNP